MIIPSTTVFSLDRARCKSVKERQVFGHPHPADPLQTKFLKNWVGWTHRKNIDIAPHLNGVQFIQKVIWRDENEEPLIDEIRTVNLYAFADATVCDMTSEKIAAYGAVTYPQTKFGSIGIRVEPRLLPVMGGIVLGDNNRSGGVEVVHEGESDFVAYQNRLLGEQQFGVFMRILDEGIRGPWFIRDYGMALYNPTWTGAVSTPAGERWTVSLRVIAYDGELTPVRADKWVSLKDGWT